MSNYIDYDDEDRPSLSMGERIVWISDNGPEYGNVRWLGKLSDLGKEWMAGVEFDNPVGSGTGLYRDRQLFVTPLNHASLVPVIGLLKASDFDGPPEPPSRSSSMKLIDFHNYGSTNQDQDLEYAMQQSLRDSQVRRSIPASNSHRSEDGKHYNNHVANNYSLNHTNNHANYRTSHERMAGGYLPVESNNLSSIYNNKKISHQSQQQQQLQSRGASAQQQLNNRVRHIPIRLEEDYEPLISSPKHVNDVNQANSTRSQPLSQHQTHAPTPPLMKSSPSSSLNRRRISNDSTNDPVNDLLDQFNRVSLSNHSRRREHSPVQTSTKQQSQSASIPQLPSPALVYRSGDKSPGKNLTNLLGKSRGIQGHNNSCYLDATLFAMFSATTLFDPLLYRPATKDDIPKYSEIQGILRDDIVRALREEPWFVSANQVMKFRTMLEQSSTITGLTDEEKDPEEFLSLLLGQILKAEPYLKLSSGGESFLYQLIVDKDENVMLPTIQDLFEQSFVSSTVRLREIPPCLMLQMPRFGRHYKMYPRIMPTLKLDITDVLESAPRACGHRGKDCDNIARYECKDCFGERSGRSSARLYSITYCHNCFKSKHFSKSHPTGIEDHDKSKTILDKTPLDVFMKYSNASKGKLLYSKEKEIPRVYMDLFAVLCIETSHYVCFVKCGQDPEAPWCFFDSMADRRGEQNGYNIPEVIMFDEFSFWTSEQGRASLMSHTDDKLLPEMPRRLICDAYLCFYQYPGSLASTHR